MRDRLLRRRSRRLLGALLLLLIGWLWAIGHGAEVTLAWDAPPPGAIATRLYETRAGECVLNAAQYTALEPDVPAPTSSVTLTVEAGASYCWLVRFVDQAGLVGNPSYVLGVRVPSPTLQAPTQLRLPSLRGR